MIPCGNGRYVPFRKASIAPKPAPSATAPAASVAPAAVAESADPTVPVPTPAVAEPLTQQHHVSSAAPAAIVLDGSTALLEALDTEAPLRPLCVKGLCLGDALAAAALVFEGEPRHRNRVGASLSFALELAEALGANATHVDSEGDEPTVDSNVAPRGTEGESDLVSGGTSSKGGLRRIADMVHADVARTLSQVAPRSIMMSSDALIATSNNLRKISLMCVHYDNVAAFRAVDQLSREHRVAFPPMEDRVAFLFYAAKRGAVLICRHLVEHEQVAPLCNRGSARGTAIHVAVRHGRANVVEYLVSRVATLLRVSMPAQLGALVGDRSTAAEESLLMIAKKDATSVPLMWPDDSGQTVQHAAVATGSLEVIRALQRCGARFDARNVITGDTPIHVAVTERHVTALRYLAEHFPEALSIPNFAGDTPIDVALLSLRETDNDAGKHEMIRIFRDRGAASTVLV